MASANVDLLRSIHAAWERGDYGSAEWADPNIEFVNADNPLSGRVSFTGLAGLKEGFRTFLSTWDEFRTEVQEYRQLDDERVLALVLYTGRGKTSGLELGRIQANAAHLYHFRAGKVTKFISYFDRERAFADLGLPSEADSSGS
jgi:ketosteroid isomerase-like protein